MFIDEALKIARTEGKVVVSCEGDRHRIKNGLLEYSNDGEWSTTILTESETNGQWTVEEEPVELPEELGKDGWASSNLNLQKTINQILRYLKAEKK